mgnify:CR=1 FL=1
MAILSKGTDFTTGDQVTAAKLDALVDNATFASDAVDDSTTALDGNGKIIVKDGGITIAKLNLSEDSPTLRLTDTDSALSDGELSSNIEFFQSDSSGSGVGASIAAHGDGSTGALDLRFATGANTANVAIDASGKVGIGTLSPTEELHVAGSGGGDPSIKLENTSTGSSDDTIIRSQIGGTTARNFIYFGDSADDNIGQIAYHHDNDSMRFLTGDDSNPTEQARINSSGIVVGRSSSSSSSNSNGIVLRKDGEIYLARDGTSSQNHLLFINNAASSATEVGSVTTNGIATSFNTSSDYRLKEDVIDMQDSISRVQALKPVNFAWKLDGTRADGFLAHEAQEIVPAAVTGTKDAVDEDGQPDYQGIDQSKLVPLLTKALQEALTKIESLEARVAALES